MQQQTKSKIEKASRSQKPISSQTSSNNIRHTTVANPAKNGAHRKFLDLLEGGAQKDTEQPTTVHTTSTVKDPDKKSTVQTSSSPDIEVSQASETDDSKTCRNNNCEYPLNNEASLESEHLSEERKEESSEIQDASEQCENKDSSIASSPAESEQPKIKSVLKKRGELSSASEKQQKSVQFGPKMVREVTKIVYPWNTDDSVTSSDDEDDSDVTNSDDDDTRSGTSVESD